MPEFYMTFASKINEISELYTTIPRKCPDFTLCLPGKNIFPDFWEEGKQLSPVSYAYGWAPGPKQLNPALAISAPHTVPVYIPSPVDSILLAVLTVSPNRQYLGIFAPTIPATTGPTTSTGSLRWSKM